MQRAGVHWSEIEGADDSAYDGDDELMSIGAPLARHFGLTRIGVHHERLPPGRRTSWPHAESREEELVFVLDGTPDLWIDGRLERLGPGDSVGFPAGTGVAHSFLNNTETDVRLLVIGEASTAANRVHYPLNLAQASHRPDLWEDPPQRPLAGHDGLTDLERAKRASDATSA